MINAFNHHFTQRTIKVIFDGALGSRGAALLKPYNDAPETSGYLTEKPEELRPMFEEALRHGIQVETHAIGDRANRTILDLYEAAFKAVPQQQGESTGADIGDFAGPAGVAHGPRRAAGGIEIAGKPNPGAPLHAGDSLGQNNGRLSLGKAGPICLEG